MYGFYHRGEVDLPLWASELYAPYWRICVERRNKSLRRKSYRTVERIKLKLVESGQDVELVEAICKYLVSHRKTSAAVVVQNLLDKPNPQMRLF